MNNNNKSKPEHSNDGEEKNHKTNGDNGSDTPRFLVPSTDEDQQQQQQQGQYDRRLPFGRSLHPSPSSDAGPNASGTPTTTNEIEKDAKSDDYTTPGSSHSQSQMRTRSHFVKSSPFASDCRSTATTPPRQATAIAPPLSHVSPAVNATHRNDAPLPRPQGLPLTHTVNGNDNGNLNSDRPPASTVALHEPQPQTTCPLPPPPTLSRSYDLQQLRRSGFSFVDGRVLNEKGQVICGVLNQHNQPCRRIGKCPFHLFVQRHRNHDPQPRLEQPARGSEAVDSAASPTSHLNATDDGIAEDDRLGQTGEAASKAGAEKSSRESGDHNSPFDCVSTSSIRSGVQNCGGAGTAVGTAAGQRSLPIGGGLPKSSVYHMNNKCGTSALSASGSGEVIGPLLPSFTAPPLASSLERARDGMRYRNGWSKEEHFKFLCGLRKYSRGCWKMIAQYVGTRTPTQVQSHAQKYYLRRTQTGKKKCSIHDLTLDSPEMLQIEEDLRNRGELDSSSCSSGGRGGGSNGVDINRRRKKRSIVDNESKDNADDNVGDDDDDETSSPNDEALEGRLQRNGQSATENTPVGGAHHGGDYHSRRWWDSHPTSVAGGTPYSTNPHLANDVFPDRFVNYNIGMGSTRQVMPLDLSHPVLPVVRSCAPVPAGLLGDAGPNGSGGLLDGNGSSGMRMTMDVGGMSASTALGLGPPPLCAPPLSDPADARQQGKSNGDRDMDNTVGIDCGRTADDIVKAEEGVIQFGDNASPPAEVVEQQQSTHASAQQQLPTENHDMFRVGLQQQQHHQLPHQGQSNEHHLNYFQHHQTHPPHVPRIGISATPTAVSTSSTGTPFTTTLTSFHHGLQQTQGTTQHYQLSEQQQNGAGYHNNLRGTGATQSLPLPVRPCNTMDQRVQSSDTEDQQQPQTVSIALQQSLTGGGLQKQHEPTQHHTAPPVGGNDGDSGGVHACVYGDNTNEYRHYVVNNNGDHNRNVNLTSSNNHSANEHVGNINANHHNYPITPHHHEQQLQQQQPLDTAPLNSVHDGLGASAQHEIHYDGTQLLRYPLPSSSGAMSQTPGRVSHDDAPAATPASAVEGLRLGPTLGKHERGVDSVAVSSAKRARRVWTGLGMGADEEMSASPQEQQQYYYGYSDARQGFEQTGAIVGGARAQLTGQAGEQKSATAAAMVGEHRHGEDHDDAEVGSDGR